MAREISFFEKDHAVNRLEGCCIDHLNRHGLPEKFVLEPTWTVTWFTSVWLDALLYDHA